MDPGEFAALAHKSPVFGWIFQVVLCLSVHEGTWVSCSSLLTLIQHIGLFGVTAATFAVTFDGRRASPMPRLTVM